MTDVDVPFDTSGLNEPTTGVHSFRGGSLNSLRLLIKSGKVTTVSKLDLSKIIGDDRRKLDREVIASKGDLLFARAIILFEGETEEQSLPIFCQTRFGMSAHELGFNFIGVGGGNYFPFIWLAKSFAIPWYVFSDGEPQPVGNLDRQLRRANEPAAKSCSNVFIIPGSNDYEKQLLDDGYLAAIETAIAALFGPKKLDDYIATLNGTPARSVGGKTVTRNYAGKRGREAACLDLMRENKTRLAAPIAQAIAALPAGEQIPKCL